MTDTQFTALADLTSLRRSKTRMGAYAVLVEGLNQQQAAQGVGVSQQAISKAVRRIKEAKRLAIKV